MKKNVVLLGLTGLVLIAPASNVAYARDADWTNGPSFKWSPTSSTTVEMFTDKLEANADFSFSVEAASINNQRYHFTMEHNVGDGQPLISDLKVSNLPDVGYDTDDDDKDGYHEEVEAYAGSNGEIEPNKDYYFLANWNKDGEVAPGTLFTVAQRSLNFIEMQAMHYDLLTSTPYGGLRENSYVIHQDSLVDSTPNIMLNEEVTTLKQLEQLKQAQYKQVNQLINEGYYENQIVEATLTFDSEISLTMLEKLIKSNFVQFIAYESKFTNEAGDWITAESTTFNEEELVTNVEELLAGREENLEFNGVTSAKVRLQVTKDVYDAITSQYGVYFVDLSASLPQYQVKGTDTNNVVSDYAWLLNQ